MASTATVPDSQLLDAAYLPPAPGLDPAVVLFGAVDLSPGAWRRAEEALEVPESARRLTLAIGDASQPRFTSTRALPVAEAVPFLLSLGGRAVRPSVNAWVLAAHIARRIHEGIMLPRGTEQTDAILDRIAAGMPASAHSVLVETGDEDDLLSLGPPAGSGVPGEAPAWLQLPARQALDGFLDVARLAIALGVEAQRTPPKRGQSRALAGLTLRLAMPRGRDGGWLVYLQQPEDGTPAREAANVAQLASVFTPIGRFDVNAPDEPLELTVDEASALVRAAADVRAMGARVQLPEELAGSLQRQLDVSITLRDGVANPDDPEGVARPRRTRPAADAPPRFRLEDLVTYDLEVALGGAAVDADELRRLARDSGSLVQLAGEWIALDDASREQLERLARAVEAHESHLAGAAALSAALSGSVTLPGGVKATVRSSGSGTLERAVRFLRDPGTFDEVVVPDGFQGELRPYQRAGLTWLAGMASLPLGGVLADDMGLGKTVQLIALLVHVRREAEAAGTEVAPAIVTCPTSLIGNWQRELARFAPELRVHVHHGPMREARPSQLDGHDVVVTSYGLVARDRDMLSAIGWSMAVFDEAQTVKNPDTEQARAVRELRADFRVALTGTPMENRLLELWAVLDLVNPGLLGTAGAFQRRFAAPIERAGDEEAAATLQAITKPFMLRRVKHDPRIVPDLPDKQERTVACTLTTEQAAMYQAVVDGALGEVRRRDGIGRRGAVLALLTRLKQVCNHPAQALARTGGDAAIIPASEAIGRSGKFDRLHAMLQEVVDEGERALVFTQYAQMGHLLAAWLPELLGCDVPFLHGGVVRAKREQLVERFQGDGDEPMVFILSLKAGGLGLNLMRAAHVFHYDRWWNPAVEDQATDRTHRIGQTRNIQVHKLVCGGTLEERIAQVIDEKRALAGRVIDVRPGSGEGWVTELGDDELAALVQLGADAVAESVEDAGR